MAEMSVVYFVRREDGAVKVGYSGEMASRLRSLRSEHGPLSVEALMPGARREEAIAHSLLNEDRLDGEWFRGPSVDQAIRHVLDAHGDPRGELFRQAWSELVVKVSLDDEGQKDLVTCMASVPGFDDSGHAIAWTFPGVLREALRQMAERNRPGRVRK